MVPPDTPPSHQSGPDPQPDAQSDPDRSRQPLKSSPLLGLGRVIGEVLPVRLPRLSRWPHAIRALRHRDYRMLWFGSMASNVGSWMQNVAQAWLVYDLTQSPLWLGIDVFAGDLPVFLLLPLGGVLADRMNRRWVLVWTNAITALLAAVLAIMSISGLLTASTVGWIVALSAMRGVMDAIRIPTSQSLLPTLVGKEDLANGIALNSIQFNLSRAVGPALAGVTLVALGVSWSFGLNALSFCAVIAALVWMHNPPVSRRATESVLTSLRGGLSYIRSRWDLVVLLAVTLVGGVLCSAINVRMLSVVAEQIFNAGPAGYSQMVSAFGLGAAAGSVVLALTSGTSRPRSWLALPLFAGLGACEVVMGLGVGGSFYAALGVIAAAGGLFVGALVNIKTVMLHSTPDAMRGRVVSLQSMAFRGGIPLGGLLAGALAAHLGIGVVLMVYGTLMLVLMPLALPGLWQKRKGAGEVAGA